MLNHTARTVKREPIPEDTLDIPLHAREDPMAILLHEQFGSVETRETFQQLKGKWLLQVQRGDGGALRAFSMRDLDATQRAAQLLVREFDCRCNICPPAGFP